MQLDFALENRLIGSITFFENLAHLWQKSDRSDIEHKKLLTLHYISQKRKYIYFGE